MYAYLCLYTVWSCSCYVFFVFMPVSDISVLTHALKVLFRFYVVVLCGMYPCSHIRIFIYSCKYEYSMYIWQRPKKRRACNRSRRPFCRIGGLATNTPCHKPIEDCSTLHRGPRQGFATEGLRQRFVTAGGYRDKPLFRATRIYIPCTYIRKHTCVHKSWSSPAHAMRV